MCNLKNNYIRICGVGDIMLGDSPKMLGIGVRKAIIKNGGNFLFSNVDGEMNCDILFGNLETILSDAGFKKNSFNLSQLRGLPVMAEVLRKVGFNVINVANNHLMQYGKDPFFETCNFLKKNGIKVIGLRGTGVWNSNPEIMDFDGFKIGFLGYADPDNYGHEPMFSLKIKKNIINDVIHLKKLVDRVVVSLHWGDEFIRSPSLEQRSYAHEIIDSGAGLILGHHPHVVQEIETYNDGVICFSLGNFISDMVWNCRTREGLVVDVEMSKKEQRLISVRKVKISEDFRPELATIDLGHVSELVRKDVDACVSREKYCINLKKLIKLNRNLGYLFLLKNFYRYSLIAYLQIWGYSIKNFVFRGVKYNR